jgi:hypothetical protein
MTVHRCAVLYFCMCVCFHACLLVYLRLLTSLLGGLHNALVSLRVWNAVCKNHAPDLALVMFEGLLLLCFHLDLSHFTVIYYKSFHFMHSQYDRSSFVLCCYLACVFACLHACLLVYLRLLTLLLGGLDNALVSLCVWNAGSKCHAPDLALVMFEGLLLLCYIWFHFILL